MSTTAKPLVLVADDDDDVRGLLEVVLTRSGFDVAVADDGEEAVRAARAARPDVVVLDVTMPRLGGFEVFRAIGGAEPGAPPVIFLTAQAHMEMRVAGLELGAADYVVKPFDARELVARVRSALRTKRQLDQLAADAALDPVTGGANRRRVLEQARELCALAARYGRPLACLLADVDRFKQLNDTFGHAAGDRVLRAVADALRSLARTSDVAGRYGGDEFVVLLPETDVYGAAALAERVHAALRSAGPEGTRVSLTIGIAGWEPGMRGPDDLLAAADRALYAGKRLGRGRTAVEDRSGKAV